MQRPERQFLVAPLAGLFGVGMGLAWVAWEAVHSTSSIRLVTLRGVGPAAVVSPAHWLVASYALIGGLLAYVLLHLGTALWRARLQPSSRGSHPGPFIACLCLFCAYAGYALDATRTRIVWSQRVVEYRVGSQDALVHRGAVYGMRLNGRRLEIEERGRVVRVDLRPFTLTDRDVLVRNLPVWARLRRLSGRRAGIEEAVWVRDPSAATE